MLVCDFLGGIKSPKKQIKLLAFSVKVGFAMPAKGTFLVGRGVHHPLYPPSHYAPASAYIHVTPIHAYIHTYNELHIKSKQNAKKMIFSNPNQIP